MSAWPCELGACGFYRWASEVGANGMPYPEELIYLGYDYARRAGEICRDPRYPRSVLMYRAGADNLIPSVPSCIIRLSPLGAIERLFIGAAVPR